MITDVVMPRMGGPELIAKLKERRSDFSIIFMSGYTEAGAVETSRIGTDAILLNKPFSTELLARKIDEVQRNSDSRAKGSAAGHPS